MWNSRVFLSSSLPSDFKQSSSSLCFAFQEWTYYSLSLSYSLAPVPTPFRAALMTVSRLWGYSLFDPIRHKRSLVSSYSTCSTMSDVLVLYYLELFWVTLRKTFLLFLCKNIHVESWEIIQISLPFSLVKAMQAYGNFKKTCKRRIFGTSE